MAYSATIDLLQKTYAKGQHRAKSEAEAGKTAAHDDLWAEVDPRDLLFALTGEKLDPAETGSWDILDAYENGYYDEWDF